MLKSMSFIFNLSGVEHPANSQDQLVSLLKMYCFYSVSPQTWFRKMSEEFYVSNRQLYSGVSSNSGKYWTVSDIFQKLSPTKGPDSWAVVAVVAGPWHEWWQSRSIPSAGCPAVASSFILTQWRQDQDEREQSRPAARGHFYTPTSRWRLPAPCTLLLKLQKHRGLSLLFCFRMIIDKYFTVLHQAPSNSLTGLSTPNWVLGCLSAKIFTSRWLHKVTKKPEDKALYNIVRHRWNVVV